MSDENPEIIIIGGGIGGLTLALMLHAPGLPCRLFEAVSDFKPLGVGINMMPHAIRVLTELGVEPALKTLGIEAREFTFFNRHGQYIFAEPCGRFAGYEYPHFSIHRGDLHGVLFAAVMDRLGADAVHLGHRCKGVEQDGSRITVRFEDAAPVTGAIAIAADGFHSAVRRQYYRRKAYSSAASIFGVGSPNGCRS